MITMIAELFTSDPSDRKRSPTLIRKPSLRRDLSVAICCFTEAVPFSGGRVKKIILHKQCIFSDFTFLDSERGSF